LPNFFFPSHDQELTKTHVNYQQIKEYLANPEAYAAAAAAPAAAADSGAGGGAAAAAAAAEPEEESDDDMVSAYLTPISDRAGSFASPVPVDPVFANRRKRTVLLTNRSLYSPTLQFPSLVFDGTDWHAIP